MDLRLIDVDDDDNSGGSISRSIELFNMIKSSDSINMHYIDDFQSAALNGYTFSCFDSAVHFRLPYAFFVHFLFTVSLFESKYSRIQHTLTLFNVDKSGSNKKGVQ